MELVIPDTVTEIKSCAFYGCTSITSVTIPDSVRTIGSIAFYGCSRLTSVYYKGTADDWAKKIRIDSDELINATRYYYSESEPELNSDGTDYDGNYWHYADGVATVWKKKG